MPPKKSRRKPATSSAATRRSTRRGEKKDDAIPEVYNELLAEAYRNNPDSFVPSDRPVKKRRLAGHAEISDLVVSSDAETQNDKGYASDASTAAQNVPSNSQPSITLNEFDQSDDDDDDDAEFEDVPLAMRDESDAGETGNEAQSSKLLQLDLSNAKDPATRAVSRRKAVTKAEREARIDVHRWHLLCLLMHVATRNRWCDNPQVHRILRPLVPKKVFKWLHVDESESQVQRKMSFERGIEEICQIWRLQWKTTEHGMRRATWRDNINWEKEKDAAGDLIDLEDFKNAAKECSGSRDIGAQLFCALLRSVAVDARLVCSLQVLPFSRVPKGETPKKGAPSYIYASAQNYGSSGRSASGKKEKILDSPYPIFWVEAFSPSIQQWLPLDAVVRYTINKPRTGFEPPGADDLNAMSYVVAFEEDGSAKDVTRKYTTWFNAKTRKIRIETLKGGAQWYADTLKHFQKAVPETRDVIEDAAMYRKLELEGMPKNVQDFKDHPIYALERHLRQNEVIEPKRELGKFSSGKNTKAENVYRRQDVYVCRSADAWYRKGRDVRVGEQPLKYVVARAKRGASIGDDANGESEGVALYAEYQTEIYVPPPVVNGKVPRNAFGNLDVYVPSMIPPGAVHVRHPMAVQAARILKMDYAEAVVGFSFRGRQGTAVIDGIVVDSHQTAAIVAVVQGLEDGLSEQIDHQRTSLLLGLWQKMLTALRVRDKVEREYGDVDGKADAVEDDDDPDFNEPSGDEAGGGFMHDADEATEATREQEAGLMLSLKDKMSVMIPEPLQRKPVVVVRSIHKVSEPVIPRLTQGLTEDLFGSEPEEGGFLAEDDYDQNQNHELELHNDVAAVGGRFFVDEDAAGGFIPDSNGSIDEAAMAGGGFMREDNSNVADEDVRVGGFMPEEVIEETSEVLAHHRTSTNSPTMDDLREDRVLAVGRYATGTKSSGESPLPDATRSQSPSGQDSLSQTSLLSHDPADDDLDTQGVDDAFDSD